MTVGIRGKLFAISLLLIAVVGLTTGAFLESRLRSELSRRIEEDLARRVETARVAVSRRDHDDLARLADLADELGRASEAHVTIADASGRVLADSALPEQALGTILADPEIRDALATGSGVARRRHQAEAGQILYVAHAFPNAAEARGVVRLAMPLSEIEAAIGELRALMLLAALVGLATAVFMSAFASELMARALRRLVEGAVALVRGERRPKIARGDEIGSLAGSLNLIASELDKTVGDLAGERDRLGTILASMHEAVVALDSGGRVVLANGAANRLLGLDEAGIGRPLLEVVRIPTLVNLASESRAGRDAVGEFEVRVPAPKQILAHAAPLRTVGGSVVVMHDVSEIRRLERMRRDFVANVSHELRTPIAVIRANAETLLGGALEEGGPQAERFVAGIHRNAERLTQLIADLLDLSRIEAGKYQMVLDTVDLESAVRQSIEGLRSRSDERGVQVTSEIEGGSAVRADATALDQIITNYLDNAIKYAGRGSQVRVRARCTEDRVRIEVEDDGPGLEPHDRQRVFERFYRIDPGRGRDVGGTGLGLSIVKHLAEAMGGAVGVEPAQERGALFWVELDRAHPRPRPSSAEAASLAPSR